MINNTFLLSLICIKHITLISLTSTGSRANRSDLFIVISIQFFISFPISTSWCQRKLRRDLENWFVALKKNLRSFMRRWTWYAVEWCRQRTLFGVYVTKDIETGKTLTWAVECGACVRCHVVIVEFYRDQHRQRVKHQFYTVRRSFKIKLRFVFIFSSSDFFSTRNFIK